MSAVNTYQDNRPASPTISTALPGALAEDVPAKAPVQPAQRPDSAELADILRAGEIPSLTAFFIAWWLYGVTRS